MKTNYFFLVSIFLLGLNVYVNGQNKSIVTNSFYSGTIGTDTIQLYLKNQGSFLSGYFYYEKDGETIEFTGNQSRSKRNISLITNYSNETGQIKINLKRNNSSLKGEYKIKKEKSPINLQLIREAYTTENYIITDSFLLGPNAKKFPFYDFTISAEWPLENNPSHHFIRQELLKILDPEALWQNVGMPEILDSIRNYHKNDYLSLKEGLTEEEKKDLLTSASLNWFQDSETTIETISENLSTIHHINTIYTGGAHGSHKEIFLNLNLSDNTVLEIYDVFTEDGLIILPNLIDQSFRALNKIDPSTSLAELGFFEDRIGKISEQFRINKKGVSFIYNEYEITTYSTMPVSVFLPYSMINLYLQPSFKMLVNKN
jgi:hypothetical protein